MQDSKTLVLTPELQFAVPSTSEKTSEKLEQNIDYKNIVFLRRFMTEQGKILSRRSTGIPAKHQRKISKAIKQARLLGLLQFVHTR